MGKIKNIALVVTGLALGIAGTHYIENYVMAPNVEVSRVFVNKYNGDIILGVKNQGHKSTVFMFGKEGTNAPVFDPAYAVALDLNGWKAYSPK
jgi:hypothetical protein